jgi:hypothetical protein
LTEHEFGHDQPGDSGRAAYRPEESAATRPGGAGYPQPPTERPQLPDSKGFVASLFDFGFTSFVTPKVVKVLYPLIMILAALGALVWVVIAFKVNAVFGIFALFILTPLYFLIVTAFYRIALELFIVIFRIADDIQALRRRGDMR